MSTKKHINELHAEINEWKGQIELVRDELKTFKDQLGKILAGNTGGEAVAEGEHFQNQFIRQGEVSDELYHELKLADHDLAEKAKGNNSADHILVDDHTALRDKATTYTRLFNDLKNEYHGYLEKWF